MSDAPEQEPPRLANPVTGRCLCGAVTITVTAMQAEIRGELPTTPRIDVRTLKKPKSTLEEKES